jgi:hypothetical protein
VAVVDFRCQNEEVRLLSRGRRREGRRRASCRIRGRRTIRRRLRELSWRVHMNEGRHCLACRKERKKTGKIRIDRPGGREEGNARVNFHLFAVVMLWHLVFSQERDFAALDHEGVFLQIDAGLVALEHVESKEQFNVTTLWKSR